MVQVRYHARMTRDMSLLRRWFAKAALAIFRDELEVAMTKRLLLFYEALLAREQILPPQKFIMAPHGS